MRTFASVWLICLTLCAAVPSVAQTQGGASIQSPVLVVESDRLYLDSAFGRRISAEIKAENDALESENRQIEAELEAEEQDLTERRKSLDPETFRDLADAFDTKVRTVRRTQDAKARAIARKLDQSRGLFLQSAAPVLDVMMREAGAAVIFERRSVFLVRNAVDITRDAVARIDLEIGDGRDLATGRRNP
ncbi:MAG: OmpH family outer membrane protein [Paracoccaceae bacterium]